MISIRPGSEGLAVLRLVVETPGLTAAEIAAELRPPARRRDAFVDGADYAAWRAARATHLSTSAARVSRLLGRLQEMRLVETRRPPRLAPGFAAARAALVDELRVDWRHLVRSLDTDPDTELDLAARATELLLERRGVAGALAQRLVAEVETGPPSARALLGPAPGGATRRAYRQLVARGVVDAPAQRHPTARGVAVALAAGGLAPAPERARVA